MKKTAIVWKRVGETPLEAIEKYRNKKHILESTPLAYAGRLDPMAEGKILILIGDECKKITAYNNLDKAYEFKILFGFESDTGDVLGLAKSDTKEVQITKQQLQSISKTFIGTHEFPYPIFSSKAVQGKQLHKWALEGRLDEIEIPKRTSRIYTLQAKNIEKITGRELYESIVQKINLLPPVTDPDKAWGSDFRREPILRQWRSLLEEKYERTYIVANAYAVVGSGTYIRTLAGEIGKKLHTKGLAYAITRTQIGSYKKIGPLGLWTKKY